MFKISIPYRIPVFFTVFSLALYMSFGYDLERSDFLKLIMLYGTLFIITYLFLAKWKLNFWFLACVGLLFRLIFFFAIPNLSQDFYRFIWDGRLVAQGLSPYLFTPEMYFKESSTSLGAIIPQADVLYRGMGSLSASHFSNYPPINQFFFAVAGILSGKSIIGSVVILRIIIILADIGILFFGSKLLQHLDLPSKNIFWYFLNPLIIIELTANLHFEGVMLFFFIAAIYLLSKGKRFGAAILIGISISVKLIPLLFLPLFLKYLPSKIGTSKILKTFGATNRLIAFYLIIGFIVVLTFLPFMSLEFLQNFSATIALWFQNFEFNASIYYIIRWIGFQIVGWNIIGTVGKILPVLILLFILAMALFRKSNTAQQLLTTMLFAISFYFLLSTTVHPWYVATPLLLSIFTKYKFPIVWSFLVILSYSAYRKDGFDENLWLVASEYIVIILWAGWEITTPRPKHRFLS